MCLFIHLDSLGLGLAYECTSWDMSFQADITAWTYMALLESTMKVLMAVKFINNSNKINRSTYFWYLQLNVLS